MKNKFLTGLLLLTISFFTFGEEPDWVNYSRAKEKYYNGEFKESLDYFLDVTKDGNFPEAEYMIGLIYLEEGELALAKDQVQKAIDLKHYLEVPQDLIHYRYKLAQILLLQEDYTQYEKLLRDISGGEIIDLTEVRDQKAYYDTLLSSGMDRLLHLYRRDPENTINANIELGYYYNSIGEYKRSVNYLLTPVISLITEVIEDNKQFDREYVFVDMETFFTEAEKNRRIHGYLYKNEFYKMFYYLGQSLLGLEEEEKAIEVWKLLADSNIESRWVKKSKEQILEPTLENWTFIY